jgi:hypothetical protein
MDTALPRMTWAEIKAAYPDQWVVIGDLEMDPETSEFRSGAVLGAGKTRREPEGQAGPLNGETRARFWTGQVRSPWRLP